MSVPSCVLMSCRRCGAQQQALEIGKIFVVPYRFALLKLSSADISLSAVNMFLPTSGDTARTCSDKSAPHVRELPAGHLNAASSF